MQISRLINHKGRRKKKKTKNFLNNRWGIFSCMKKPLSSIKQKKKFKEEIIFDNLTQPFFTFPNLA
jgi:hypothetical protein